MVRVGRDLKSPAEGERLATGAAVEELDLHGERLHYKLATGSGPEEGWVSLRVGGKDLLVPQGQHVRRRDEEAEAEDAWQAPASREASESAIRASAGRPRDVLGLGPSAPSSSVRRAYHCLALMHHPDKGGDAAIFKAVADAYRALTDAKDHGEPLV